MLVGGSYQKIRPEILSLTAALHKSTDKMKKITVHLQRLTNPYQIDVVRRFGEFWQRENEMDVLARQRSQQLRPENPQFYAVSVDINRIRE